MTIGGRRRWRPGLLAAGLALIAGSMLLGLLLFRTADTATSVLVAAVDLEPGQPLEPSDFRIRRVVLDEGVAAVTAAEQGAVLGGEPRTVKSFVPAGTMVTEDHFIPRSESLAQGQVVIGVRLQAGEYPARLAVGDVVELYGAGDRGVGEAVLLGRAEVRFLDRSDSSSELVADLLIEDATQSAAIQAHASDRLRLALVRGG